MNLNEVATRAVSDASDAIGKSLSGAELDQVTAIIAKAMEKAILEASSQHSSICVECLDHDQDMAHKLQKEIELKKVALIANLSSLR